MRGRTNNLYFRILTKKKKNLSGCSSDLSLLHSRFLTPVSESTIASEVYRTISIPLYTGLRSSISRLIVNGYRIPDVLILKNTPSLKTTFKPPKHCQQTWSKSISNFKNNVTTPILPSDKINGIISTSKVIEKEYKGTEHLAADDYLPIFIHIILEGGAGERCYSLVELCKIFLREEERLGEKGYWLATVEAAVEFIRCKGEEVKEEEEEVKDELFGKERLEGLLAQSGFLG